MLNTDLHSAQIKAKMTTAEFERSNRGIDAGADLPRELLREVYDDIATEEIRTGMEWGDLGEVTLRSHKITLRSHEIT